MENGKENIPLGTLIKLVLLRIALAFGILAALILIPMGLNHWERAKTIRKVEQEAGTYLDEIYPGHDFLWKAYYEPKIQGYMVTVQSQSSRDTRFELEYGEDGFSWDTYEFAVLSCNSTRARVAEEYDAAVREVLKDIPVREVEGELFDSKGGSRVGEAVSAPDTVQWVLDQEYDVSWVGAQIGYVTLWLDGTNENCPPEKLDELVRQAARALEEAEIGFYAIDIMLADSRYYGSPLFHFEKRVLFVDLQEGYRDG